MPILKQYDENLFADSSMTFGEHLEELRTCLWRAVLGLMAGIVVGFFLGGPVVNLIQMPLTNALTKFYQNDALNKIKDAQSIKQDVQEPLDESAALQQIKSSKKLADEVFVDPADLFNALKKAYPDYFQNSPPALTTDKHDLGSGLVPILLWHSLDDDPRIRVKSFNAHEAFGIYIKAAIMVGLLISGPWIFYQIWLFVAAGLYPHEKRYIHIYLPVSIGLFFFGAILAFCFVFEPVLNFLISFNQWLGIDLDPRISEWMSFVLLLPIGFGIGFQLPLVMFFLERVGIVSAGLFSRHWRVSILIIWILASVLTPPDPYSQFLLGIPLTFLYFGGILLCKYMPRRQGQFENIVPDP